jgi:uncharacterized protein YhbP (UPF0306 family)
VDIARQASNRSNLMDVTHTQQVAAFLKSQSTLSLATTALNGAPQVAPLFYLADDELRLYWLSSAFSQHSRNLKRSPAAAVCVYSPTEQWKEIRGVQMRGAVSVVTARSQRRAIVEAYCARFHLEPLFRGDIARSRLYRFQPEWVRYLDNSKRFGYKFELRVKAPLA